MVSKQCFASGAWPDLRTVERQRLHANIMDFLRSATSERYVDGEPHEYFTDAAFLQLYEARAPYVHVRFARLRLCVRLIWKSLPALLTLLYQARNDARSWVKGLEQDLLWMHLLDQARHYTVASWCSFCSAAPKAARNCVRELCDSKEARSPELAESQPRFARLSECLSCHCGAVFLCKRTLAAHQFKKHATRPAVNRYADPSNACLICLTQFSNRQLLCDHLKHNEICLLNSVLRMPPTSTEVEMLVLAREQAKTT